ncbi:MAG TPA: hypothetical protein VGN12_02325 [Pirellulales bacterium]|jgi:hypothetical protein
MDKYGPFSFLGWLVGAIALGIAIYLWPRTPSIRIEQIANYNVLELKEGVSALEVMLNGKDILKSGETLSIVIVRVSNDGGASVRLPDYDERALLGIDVVNASLVSPPQLISATREYLTESLGPRATTSSMGDKHNACTVEFNPVILNPSDAFELKLLVLHAVGTVPTISPRGTIAGVSKILLTDESAERSPLLWSAFHGGLLVQSIRVVAYFLGALLALVVTIRVLTGVGSSISTTLKNRMIRNFERARGVRLDHRGHALVSRLADEPLAHLLAMRAVLDDPTHQKPEGGLQWPADYYERGGIRGPYGSLWRFDIVTEENGVVSKVNTKRARIFREFVDHLERNHKRPDQHVVNAQLPSESKAANKTQKRKRT